MAVARSGTGVAGGVVGASLTFAHDNGSPTNGMTVVSAGNLQGADTLTGVTYAGNAMTEVNYIGAVIDNWLFAITAPTAGSNDVVASFSASQTIRAVAASYSGVVQTLPPDSNNTGFDDGSAARALTVSTTVVAENCWLVGGAQNDSGATSAGTGANEVVASGAGTQ